jgi:transposase
MDTIIAAPASCKVRVVIRFLHAEGQSAAEIRRQLCRVFGDNVVSDSCVTEWCRKFRDGRTDMRDKGGQERHSIVTDKLVQKVDKCLREKRHFTISKLPEEFPQTSRATLYRTVMGRLVYHTFCARWVPKQLIDLAA